MRLTSHDDIDALLHELLARMRHTLGENLIGLYLYGSLAWGDFDHDISDIDMLAVLSTDFDQKHLERLKVMHQNFVQEFKEWDERIEVQYIAAQLLKTFPTTVGTMAVISPGEPLHVVEANELWLMNWYFARTYGVTLFGPEPTSLIAPISDEDFLQRVRKDAHFWLEYVERTRHSRPYQAYAILTLCRALYAVRTGEQVSKKTAAHWAVQELPQHAPLIENALRWRQDYRNKAVDPEVTYPATAEFVHFVAELIGEI